MFRLPTGNIVLPPPPVARREKLLQLKRSKILVSCPKAAKCSKMSDDEPEASRSPSGTPVSLTEFPEISVIHVLEASSRCTMAKIIPGNMAHFFKQRMTNLVTALMNEMDENDDNFPNIGCELVTRYPGYTMDTYHITSALLVLSLRLGLKDRPDELVDMLCVRPSHLPVTASVRSPVHKSLVVGNYNLSPADMDTAVLLNSAFHHNTYKYEDYTQQDLQQINT